MPSKQIRDVLDSIRQFKHRFVDAFDAQAKSEQNETSRFMLEYISRHEKRFEEALESYEEEASKNILDTWVQFVDQKSLDKIFGELQLKRAMSPDDLVQVALQFDSALLKLYREAAESTSAAHVRAIFEDLAKMEEAKDHQYAKSLLM